MDEANWLTWDYPSDLLDYLGEEVSERKLRLFACVCARAIWHLLTDSVCRTAIVVAEQFADGEISREVLSSARNRAGDMQRAAQATFFSNPGPTKEVTLAECSASLAATITEEEFHHRVARDVSDEASHYAGVVAIPPHHWGTTDGDEIHLKVAGGEAVKHAHYFRDIVGLFHYRPIAVDPAWLAWNHGTVPAIARHIYGERAFHDLPILADALEDAGCADADILAHCRQGGEHVRGCWVVDLLLGKA